MKNTNWISGRMDPGDDRYVPCYEVDIDTEEIIGTALRPYKTCADCSARTVDWTSLSVPKDLITVCMDCKEARKKDRT